MRTIERSSAFKRDYKRVKATPRHSNDVDSLVSAVAAMLLVDQALPESNRDHALSGDWSGCWLIRKRDVIQQRFHAGGRGTAYGAVPLYCATGQDELAIGHL